jgi:hypothetical protein
VPDEKLPDGLLDGETPAEAGGRKVRSDAGFAEAHAVDRHALSAGPERAWVELVVNHDGAPIAASLEARICCLRAASGAEGDEAAHDW